MRSTFSQDAEISFKVTGTGKTTLLCLSGWCDNQKVFDLIEPHLSRHYRVITMDWRGHGLSKTFTNKSFGYSDLVQDALAVLKAAGHDEVIPVAASHAGWVAIELRRTLGATIRAMVLLDWIVLNPPAPFLDALTALQNPNLWKTIQEKLFMMWLGGTENSAVSKHLSENMKPYGFEMWALAGKEISSAYAQHEFPLKVLNELDPPCPVLHLYAQANDPGYFDAQKSFSKDNYWFSVQQLNAKSHFPVIEAPEAVASAIHQFILCTI